MLKWFVHGVQIIALATALMLTIVVLTVLGNAMLPVVTFGGDDWVYFRALSSGVSRGGVGKWNGARSE